MRLLGLALSLLAAPATGLCSGPAAGADSAPPAAAAPRAENTTPAPEDRLGFLRTLTIDGDETARDAVCVFCPVVVRGTVQRDAVAVWGGVDVEGQVGVDAVALGGALRVARGARVGGDPVALGGPVEADPGGILAEEPSALPWLLLPGQREVFAIGALVFVGAHLLLALAGAVLLGERRVAHLAALWRWSPGRALLVGCGAFTLVVALISLGGTLGEGSAAVAGILGALLLAGAFAIGMPGVATALAHRVRSSLGWRSAALGGTLAIALLSLVPVAGLGATLLMWCAVCGLAIRGGTLRKAAAGSQADAPDNVLRYYALGLEKGRLDEAYFPLERARTQELIQRHLPPAPGVVLDVGGAAGAYSFWLAERGYEVHLVDPTPLHIEQAEDTSRSRETGRLASARVGDARRLDFADASADAVLLLGPLYHLTERGERQAALEEARRVLQPGGWLFAAAISRFASLLDGLRGFVFDDETFAHIVEDDLVDGQHRNETGNPLYFTTAFFHHPGELSAEVREAGFTLNGLYAVEGPGAFVPEFRRRWEDPKSRERLLDLLRRVEGEPALLGASPHLLAVGQKA